MAAGLRDEHALGVQGERLGSRGERGALGRPRPVAVILAIYTAAGTLSVVVSLALGLDPVTCRAWLGTTGAASWLLSLGLGVLLGASTTFTTRTLVRRFRWARALHLALRPAVHGTDDASLLLVALASAAGEELLFRGLLVQVAGVIASSIVFGALHQIRGRARWGWMAWATVMGFAFGTVFAATGSLAGPLVAHAAINHSNLRFLRDNDPRPRRKTPLGGLLKRS
jgi:membrane protease YdiL (CAAX protease family)